MRVTATLGPGHHGGLLLDALRAGGIQFRAVSAWPDLAVEDWPGQKKIHAWYRRSRRVMWGAWRRLPWLGAHETPRVLDLWVYEVFAARQLEPCDLFLGWSQVSLRGIRRAKQLGVPSLLEHPMTHVGAWTRIMAEEYARWGGRAFYSQFPRSLAARMEAEVREADYISVLSTFARRTFLDEGVAAEKLLELPLGVDHRRFSPGAPHEGGYTALFVGRLELLKGVQYLLEAVEPLPNLTTRLVGTRYPEIEPMLRRHPHVECLTGVPSAQLTEQYRRADVLVFPSLNDALGLVILEAMACGLPVIATDRSGGPDIISDGVDGFVVPARDPAALRDRLERLRDPALRKKMGEAARAKILSNYTLDHYAGRVVRILERLQAATTRR